ncbi:MAG TPA: hypothetical protein VJH92_06530 [Candidatus Nanoarchaeia archaeon]|nr:hypothetical protein [Candidatus Nanoarchaeia archaeon]
MFKGKELAVIIVTTIILAFSITLVKSLTIFLYALLGIFLVVIINILAKKITSYGLDSEIEIKFWEVKRYGFRPKSYFKNPLAMGLFMPIIVLALTLGSLYWMACLVFDVKAKVYRSAKRFGLYAFSEMTERHIGLIAASGIIANLLLALIGYIAGFEEFARFNIYYAAFNMIPFSDLDGNKIFYGSMVFWSFLGILTLIGLGYAFLLV